MYVYMYLNISDILQIDIGNYLGLCITQLWTMAHTSPVATDVAVRARKPAGRRSGATLHRYILVKIRVQVPKYRGFWVSCKGLVFWCSVSTAYLSTWTLGIQLGCTCFFCCWDVGESRKDLRDAGDDSTRAGGRVFSKMPKHAVQETRNVATMEM